MTANFTTHWCDCCVRSAVVNIRFNTGHTCSFLLITGCSEFAIVCMWLSHVFTHANVIRIYGLWWCFEINCFSMWDQLNLTLGTITIVLLYYLHQSAGDQGSFYVIHVLTFEFCLSTVQFITPFTRGRKSLCCCVRHIILQMSHLACGLNPSNTANIEHTPSSSQTQHHPPLQTSSVLYCLWDVQGLSVPEVVHCRAALAFWN